MIWRSPYRKKISGSNFVQKSSCQGFSVARGLNNPRQDQDRVLDRTVLWLNPELCFDYAEFCWSSTGILYCYTARLRTQIERRTEVLGRNGLYSLCMFDRTRLTGQKVAPESATFGKLHRRCCAPRRWITWTNFQFENISM